MSVSEQKQAQMLRVARGWAREYPDMTFPNVCALADRLAVYGQAQGFPRPEGRPPWNLVVAKGALDEVYGTADATPQE